jgi:hypothetical protein
LGAQMTDDLAIGVDIGGSSIKAAAVKTSARTLSWKRLKVPLPRLSDPMAVVAAVARLVRRLESMVGRTGLPVGEDVPAVVDDGVTKTAANIDAGLISLIWPVRSARLLDDTYVCLTTRMLRASPRCASAPALGGAGPC